MSATPRRMVCQEARATANDGVLAFQYHAGDGVFSGMRERKGDVLCTEPGGGFCSSAMKTDRRTASRLAENFDVAPAYAMAPACPKRFHGRFFRSKACRVSFDTVGLGIAVSPLFFGEDAMKEPISELGDRFGNPWHFADVNSCADDHGDKLARVTGMSRRRLATPCPAFRSGRAQARRSKLRLSRRCRKLQSKRSPR